MIEDKNLELVDCPTCRGAGDVPKPRRRPARSYREWCERNKRVTCLNCEGTGGVWQERRRQIQFAMTTASTVCGPGWLGACSTVAHVGPSCTHVGTYYARQAAIASAGLQAQPRNYQEWFNGFQARRARQEQTQGLFGGLFGGHL